jgi:hypothetical protein
MLWFPAFCCPDTNVYLAFLALTSGSSSLLMTTTSLQNIFSPSKWTLSAQITRWCVPNSFKPSVCSWTILLSYHKANFKSSDNNESFRFRLFWILNMSETSPSPSSLHGSTALVGLGLLYIEVSRSHSEATSHSVGLLLASVRPIAETSDNKQQSPTTGMHARGGIRTRNPSKRATEDPLRSRGHRDRPKKYYRLNNRYNSGLHTFQKA